MAKVKLSVDDEMVLIDEADFKLVSQFRWRIDKYTGYVRSIGKANILMHRLIIKPSKGLQVDHINFNKLDNRKTNLRMCTARQNSLYRPINKNNSSGFKGVSFRKDRGLYEAYIMVNRLRKHLGLFKDKIEAAKAYNKAAKLYFGEFAGLNDVKD